MKKCEHCKRKTKSDADVDFRRICDVCKQDNYVTLKK